MSGPSGAAGHQAVQVVPLLRLRALAGRTFDYTVPDDFEESVGRGDVVVVSFGRRRVRGVVVAVGPSEELMVGRVPADKVQPLLARAPDSIPEDLVTLAERLARYSLAPLGACLQAVAPPALAAKTRSRRVLWVSPGEPGPPPPTAADATAPATAEGPASPPPTDQPLTDKQRAALAAVPATGARLADALRAAGVGRAVVQALVARGLLKLEQVPADEAARRAAGALPVDAVSAGEEHVAKGDEDPLGHPGGAETLEPTPEQAEALRVLLESLDSSEPQRHVLWGVTGSGKTEVYLRLLARVREQRGGALLLVPEIALTGQTVARLTERLGRRIAVLHSGLTPAQRLRAYRSIASGEVRLVVGARSAVFAPVADLRLIILDEAHDTSYKQEEEPRYDARTVAWWRAQSVRGIVVEGTATPRVESLTFPQAPLRLRARPSGTPLPAVEVVDMRRQGGRRALAPRAQAALQGVVTGGGQAIILLNRRGYSSFLLCDVCGHVLTCPRCEISLTYHRSQQAVLCHACGFRLDVPGTCPVCHEAALSRGAPGTQRLVEELLNLVPRSHLFRLDSDVVTSGVRVDELLAQFEATASGVLVGTQMVAKGHDFPRVELAIVVDADVGLFNPDFRSGERTFQLLTQVAGRPGRREHAGRVMVQTWNPDVACIRMALAREEEAFYQAELAARERLGYPPFRSLIRLVTGSAREEPARSAALYLAERLQPHLSPDELLGPARLPRLRGVSRWQLLLALRDEERGRRLLQRALDRFREPYARRGVDVIVDVDPQSFQ